MKDLFCMSRCRILTCELQRFGQCQDCDISTVIINVGIDKGQVTAVVHDCFHLSDHNVLTDRGVIDGPHKNPPP